MWCAWLLDCSDARGDGVDVRLGEQGALAGRECRDVGGVEEARERLPQGRALPGAVAGPGRQEAVLVVVSAEQELLRLT